MTAVVRAAVLLGVVAGAGAGAGSARGADEAGAADGAAVFARNCALCHQSNARGLPNQYPRLAGRVDHIGDKPLGRAYLIDVVTYGMAGQITVDKQSIIGVMPALQLSDDDAARVLNYIQSLGAARTKPFTPQEITAERAKPHKSAADVHAERQMLQAVKIIE
jgi:mono/diheme cytochrome c family protein